MTGADLEGAEKPPPIHTTSWSLPGWVTPGTSSSLAASESSLSKGKGPWQARQRSLSVPRNPEGI